METDNNQTPIQIAWINFTKSVQILLVPQIDDRPLDQYLEFRDAVIKLVQSEQFLNDINEAWMPFNFPEDNKIYNILFLELQAFPRAVDVARINEKPEEAKGMWRKMLGRASTVSGSVKDLVDTLPPYAKAALTLFKELIDLFKGKD